MSVGVRVGGVSLKSQPSFNWTGSGTPLGRRCNIITRSMPGRSGQAIPSGATYGVWPGPQSRK